jgi:hypothetical protein
VKKQIAQVVFFVVLLMRASLAVAQETPPVPALNAPAPKKNTVDDPTELSKLGETCGSFNFKSAAGCAELLFTGHPVHIAVGSLAPQNGFGAGLAFVGFIRPTENWRPSWDADAVATPNGSWRAGVYFKFVHTPAPLIVVHHGKPKIKSNLTELPEHTVFNLYAQATSLNIVTFFGLGPSTTEAGRSYFGIREIIAGANVVKPIFSRWNISLLGETNGRLVDIRPSSGNSSPTIAALYNETTAPGLSTQPGFLQLGEAFRMRPIFLDDLLHLNYVASYQQFFSPSNTKYTFQRFTVDLSHDFALYKSTTRFYIPRDGNGPDECSIDRINEFPGCSLIKKDQVKSCEELSGKDSKPCKAISRDLQGSVSFRFFLSTSFTQGQRVVPFYFQPTLGGGDINGTATLASYQDYRFRAPSVMFLRQSFEHSIWGPLGFALSADEGKVALNGSDLGSNPWIRSYSTGLTLRAGGFPQVYLLFSWGGNEGTHTIASVNTSLLGGSTRPSLF